MTPEQFQARKRQLIDQERKNQPGWWWLSFARPNEFVGVAIVQGQGMVTAIDRANRLRLNPFDCEVAGWEIPPENVPPVEARDRLLSKVELQRLFGDAKSIRELEAEREGRKDA